MKNLISFILQTMLALNGMILLFILVIFLLIGGFHLGKIWDNYLIKYSGLKETKICKVLK